MITYELCLLLRMMPKAEMVSVLKRTAETIYRKGGIIRTIENLGTRPMPFKTSIHGMVHKEASYFLMEFNVPPATVQDLLDDYTRDVDIVRKNIYKKPPSNQPKVECTIYEEMQPAPYRKDVQELIEKANANKEKPHFAYNTGLDYYPFQK